MALWRRSAEFGYLLKDRDARRGWTSSPRRRRARRPGGGSLRSTPKVVAGLVADVGSGGPLAAGCVERERSVLELMAQGLTSVAIATHASH